MIAESLVTTVQDLRSAFLESLSALYEWVQQKSHSFEKVHAASDEVKAKLNELIALAQGPRLQAECVPEFACAFVGSSGDGKTSILAEMFPNLAQRGWLQTAVTDTTSQALIIRHGPANSADRERVMVHSWTIEQITRLANAAKRENDRHYIKVRSLDDHVEVDGSDAVFEAEIVRQFKFGLRQQLRPLPRLYELTSEERTNTKRIRTLTVKEDSDKVTRDTVLSIDGQNFHALQLRAVIKDIDLRDPFDRIAAWAGPDAAEVGRLVFIDTPGLNISGGSTKDEVLRHILARKNHQIIVELLRNDGLDLIIHIVLCGKKSYFNELWGPVEEQCDPDELGDLGERLVLVINGVNIFLTNDDLKRLWSNPQAAELEGDHIATVVEDNVLKKISDRAHLKPASICFVDSKRIVEGATSRPYQDVYTGYRAVLESWGRPGAVGYQTLHRLGLLATYQANLDALCDPEDRGQGFLIKQILRLLKQNGPKFFIRKYVHRSKLFKGIKELRELLLGYYDSEGRLNRKSIQGAVQAFFSFLDPDNPVSIESFARHHIGPLIDQIPLQVPENTKPQKWVAIAFEKACKGVFAEAKRLARPSKDIEEIFRSYFGGLINKWVKDWGYRGANLPLPTPQDPAIGELVRHCLRFHTREVIHQLIVRNPEEDTLGNVLQDDADRSAMKTILDVLDQAQQQAEALCRQHGVPLS